MFQYDIYDDRCAEECADGRDGERVGEARANQVAEEQDVASCQRRGRQGEPVVGGLEDAARYMRHRHADEGYRSAVGGDAARQQPRRHHYPQPHALHAYAQPAGVLLAQCQPVERLHQKEADQQARARHGCEYRYLLPRHAAQRAERPHDKQFERIGVGEVLYQVDQRAGDGAEHHAHNQQRHVAPHAPRYRHHQQQHQRRARDSRSEDRERRCRHAEELHAAHRCDSHAEACAGRHAEGVGSRQRVAEERLHQQSRHRQPHARHQCGERFGQAQIEQNLPRQVGSGGIEQQQRIEPYRPAAQVADEENEQRQAERKVYAGVLRHGGW